MVYGTYLSFCCMFLSICLVVSDSEKKDVSAEPGQTVILPCQADRNIPVTAVEWIRLNGPTVCLYWGNMFGQCERDDQSQFQGRVQLNNEECVKNGNVSLILKNVTINDAGTYECRVEQRESPRQKRAGYLNAELIDTIILKVENSWGGGDKNGGDKDGHVPLIVILSLVVLLLVAVGFLIYRKRFRRLNSNERPADEDVEYHLQSGVMDTRMEEMFMDCNLAWEL